MLRCTRVTPPERFRLGPEYRIERGRGLRFLVI
jgi:hypothetical protein